ncbi:potassium-transporting ATPase subunit KdpC [Candidatus Obscuribacterales bacterium]|nr:potassium-transporting ATPase subunit KdpC [Candidatus Obscuribacterales bacterium]
MRDLVIQSLLLYFVLTILTGVIYPGAVTMVAQLAWPQAANGSLIKDETTGGTIGSSLLGQEFTSDQYFWGRLSATTPPYNAAASSGSNLGPLSPSLLKNAKARIEALKVPAGKSSKVPVDLVTSSASGLDPHISPASALLQAERVASARGLTEHEVEELIKQNTEGKQFAVFGESRVNVLQLNLALDRLNRPASSAPKPNR